MGDTPFTLQGGGRKIHLETIFELFGMLSNSIYVGAFRNIINIGGAADYYDILIGENFVGTWHDWGTGFSRDRNKLINQVCENIGQLFGYKNL